MNESSAASSYRVLARKYRPQTFTELVGQEVLVRTLTNAIRARRLPHAFVLTGVRGVGKTSTARIIAKAMNCSGQGDGPTENPCGACENCVAISQDRHVDVLEMDAASHTGVDDIRGLIDGVRYAPVSGRYKVYIIDEVHMLSRNAFNALLKTLEEPPPHAMFVFATTEVRRIPVTVLSRCMRFDLRRIESQLLTAHLANVCGIESISIEEAALDIIARAAEGSVRDALSLLDQAVALAGEKISIDQVRDMLGLADGTLVYNLFEKVMCGDSAGALASLADLVAAGAEPDLILEDLLALTHWLTRVKVVPDSLDNLQVTETDRTRGAALANTLPMPALTRAWQILLKGLAEVRSAPSPGAAAEMVIVRLGFAANLPTPAELVRQAHESDNSHEAGPHSAGPSTNDRTQTSAILSTVTRNATLLAVAPQPTEEKAEYSGEVLPNDGTKTPRTRMLSDFKSVVEFVREIREPILETNLRNNVHLVSFNPGRIELRLDDKADKNLPNRLGALLSDGTGQRWVVSVSQAAGAPTLNEQLENAAQDRRAKIERHPLVRKALDMFPGAEVKEIRDVAINVYDDVDDVAIDPSERGFYEE